MVLVAVAAVSAVPLKQCPLAACKDKLPSPINCVMHPGCFQTSGICMHARLVWHRCMSHEVAHPLTQGCWCVCHAVSGCAGQGDRLFSGSCSAFVGYFQSRADSAIGQSNSAFSVTVSQAPTPSDACCRDARQFTSSVSLGCTATSQEACNPLLLMLRNACTLVFHPVVAIPC